MFTFVAGRKLQQLQQHSPKYIKRHVPDSCQAVQQRFHHMQWSLIMASMHEVDCAPLFWWPQNVIIEGCLVTGLYIYIYILCLCVHVWTKMKVFSSTCAACRQLRRLVQDSATPLLSLGQVYPLHVTKAPTGPACAGMRRPCWQQQELQYL